ncbi:MAG: hypothetical protein Kow0077_13180 [Anaerolineae bacterium]
MCPPRNVPPQSLWAEYARTVNAAHRAVHDAYRAYRQRPGEPALKAAWETAAAHFHRVLTEYPPGFWQALDRLKADDAAGLEDVLAFLEADPWCFRSGYARQTALRAITRVPLSPRATARLQRVVLNAIDGRDRREFRWYCRLARRVLSPDFIAAIEARLESPDDGVRRRARWVLNAIEKHGPLTPER